MKASSLILTLAAGMALTGCASLLGGGDHTPTTVYAPQAKVTLDQAWPSIPWTVVVYQPTAARMLDSSRIPVRPTPDELQVYQGIAWAQNSTSMLQDAVVRALQDSGKTAGSNTTESGIRADFKLLLDIRRFESDYAGQAVPSVVMVVNVSLVRNYDQSVAASRTFQVTQPATSTAPVQVVQAFDQALSQLATQIVGWTLTSAQANPQIDSRATPPNAAKR